MPRHESRAAQAKRHRIRAGVPRAREDHRRRAHGKLGQSDRRRAGFGQSPSARPVPGTGRDPRSFAGFEALRWRCGALPSGDRIHSLGSGLRVRPLLQSFHRSGGPPAAPARGRLRLLSQAPPHPVSARRRSRRRKNHHGGTACQGIESPKRRKSAVWCRKSSRASFLGPRRRPGFHPKHGSGTGMCTASGVCRAI